MEIFDVPKIRQLPELSTNQEGSIAFADRVLTSLLEYDSGFLHAEHNGTDSSVSWRVETRKELASIQNIEIAASPDEEVFVPCSLGSGTTTWEASFTMATLYVGCDKAVVCIVVT